MNAKVVKKLRKIARKEEKEVMESIRYKISKLPFRQRLIVGFWLVVGRP